jgi:hypothetical protein
MAPCGEIGNQDNTILTSSTRRYQLRNQQTRVTRDAMVSVGEKLMVQLMEPVSSSRLRSSAETSTSEGVSRYT